MLERGKQKNVGKTFDYSGHFKDVCHDFERSLVHNRCGFIV